MLLPVVFFFELDFCNLALFFVEHLRVLLEDILLGLIVLQLSLQLLLQVLALVLKVKNAPVASRVDNFSFDHVDLFAQEGDALPLLGDFAFVVGALLVLQLNNVGFVLTHLVELGLALNEL